MFTMRHEPARPKIGPAMVRPSALDRLKSTSKPLRASEFLQRYLGNSFAAGLDGALLQRTPSCTCGGACGTCSDTREVELSRIQPSLVVGAADDPYEQEAEQMADRVMSLSEADEPVMGTSSAPAGLQRQEADTTTSEENPLREQIEMLLAGEGVQAKSAAPALAPPAGFESVLSSTKGRGQGLPEPVKTEMETAFGADFGAVRLHTDDSAVEMSKQINAHAFTHGHDIYFNSGTFEPSTPTGKRLLAHELTHTVQQTGDRIGRLTITRPSPRTTLSCGGRSVRWVFSLDTPAPAAGYIVQKIRSLQTIEPCPSDVRSISLTPTLQFWEAWNVNAGDTHETLHSRFGFTDESSRAPEPTKSGCQASLGTVKFFLQSVTGDLGSMNTAPSTPGSAWGPGRVPASGGQPSTGSEPSWWSSSPTEGPASRWASAWWNCCGDAATARNETDSMP